MAVNASRLGNAIVDRLRADGWYPIGPHDSYYDTRSRLIWTAISDEILKELLSNMQIQFNDGDFIIDPNTFHTHFTGDPIDGTGLSEAILLSTRLR